MRMHPFVLTVALAGVALGVSACGSDEGGSAATGTASTAAGTAAFDAADVVFLQSMIPHHEQAVEMAGLALDPKAGAGAAVRALATRVQAAQDPEITQMQAWLTAWGEPTQMDMSHGHEHSTMEGMMTAADMQTLGGATGAAFDELWLAMMIEHHRGAVAMARTVKAEGRNPDVAALGDRIIAAQQAEIAEMDALLQR